jgi:hypothetical protein
LQQDKKAGSVFNEVKADREMNVGFSMGAAGQRRQGRAGEAGLGDRASNKSAAAAQSPETMDAASKGR